MISSRLGGWVVFPDPFPDGPDPHGDWLLKILSLKLMTLYIVTLLLKTS